MASVGGCCHCQFDFLPWVLGKKKDFPPLESPPVRFFSDSRVLSESVTDARKKKH
jgi:hypothetical protein